MEAEYTLECEETPPFAARKSREEVIQDVENLITSLLERCSEQAPLAITFNRFSRHDGAIRSSTIKFGKPTFNVLLRVLSEVYKLLISNSKRTLRDIYYSDPMFFKQQSAVNDAVVRICEILQVRRECLCVTATASGLVAGPISIKLDTVMVVETCPSLNTNVLLPLIPADSDYLVSSSAEFVLVVEKDTIFQVCYDEQSFHNDFLHIATAG